MRVEDLDADGEPELLTVDAFDAWSLNAIRVFEIESHGRSRTPREVFRFYHRGTIRGLAIGPAPAWLDATCIVWVAAYQNDEAHQEILGFRLDDAADALVALPLRRDMFLVRQDPYVTCAAHWDREHETMADSLGIPVHPHPELFTLVAAPFQITEDCELVLKAPDQRARPEMTPSDRGLQMKAYGYSLTVDMTKPDAVSAAADIWLSSARRCFDGEGLRTAGGTVMTTDTELIARLFRLATGAPGEVFLGNIRDARPEYATLWSPGSPSP